MTRWIACALLVGAAGCSEKIDAKGEAGRGYGLLFEGRVEAPSLLAHADGLTGMDPEAVVVVQSLNALVGPKLIAKLGESGPVKAALTQVQATIGVDPLKTVAMDAPIALVASDAGAVVRLTLAPDGLMAFQSAMNTVLGEAQAFEVLGFKGHLQIDGADEFCALTKGREVLIGGGQGRTCSRLPELAKVGAEWRTGLEVGGSPATPIAALYHGDTRKKGEPTGIGFIDALEAMPGLDHERGYFEISAPGDEIALRYRAKPVDVATLGAAVDAARDRLPPLSAAPADDPLVFQFLLPAVMREGFDAQMLNGVLGADLFPTEWPADEVMPVLASFGAFGGTMALGAGTEARRTATLGRLGGEAAHFEDAKAWKIAKGFCGEGPRQQVYCGSTRRRLSSALARARDTTVPAGQALYLRFDLSSFQADPARHGFPAEAIGFVKAVRYGVLQARLVDGWFELDAQLKGSDTPVRTQALEWLAQLL